MIELWTSDVYFHPVPSGSVFYVPGPITLEASEFSDGMNQVFFEISEGAEGIVLDGLTEFETYRWGRAIASKSSSPPGPSGGRDRPNPRGAAYL